MFWCCNLAANRWNAHAMRHVLNPLVQQPFCQPFQLSRRHAFLNASTPHFDANVIKHRLAPREFRATRIAIRLVAPALVFGHHVIGVQPERVSSAFSHQRHKFRQIWWPRIASGTATQAASNNFGNLVIRQMSNRRRPRWRRFRPVLGNPAIRVNLDHRLPQPVQHQHCAGIELP